MSTVLFLRYTLGKQSQDPGWIRGSVLRRFTIPLAAIPVSSLRLFIFFYFLLFNANWIESILFNWGWGLCVGLYRASTMGCPLFLGHSWVLPPSVPRAVQSRRRRPRAAILEAPQRTSICSKFWSRVVLQNHGVVRGCCTTQAWAQPLKIRQFHTSACTRLCRGLYDLQKTKGCPTLFWWMFQTFACAGRCTVNRN